MKTTFFLKQLDYYMQCLLLFASILLLITGPGVALGAYIGLGGWQLLSTIVHRAVPRQYYTSRKRLYYELIIALFLFSLAFFEIDLFCWITFIIILCSPFLAFWHLAICEKELETIRRKAFVHLRN
jgi:hypothetical protein